MKTESLYGKSYAVASAVGAQLTGVIQVFPLIHYEVGVELRIEAATNARARARLAAMSAKNAWEHILGEDLIVAEIEGDRCSVTLNTGKEWRRIS